MTDDCGARPGSEELDLGFLDQVSRQPGCERIRHCIQCGTCSATCAVGWALEDSPRRLFARIRTGQRKRVLASSTPWTCATCHECAVHCPKLIGIPEVMHALKRMAIREMPDRTEPGRLLSEAFVDVVKQYGRCHEAQVMVRFLRRNRLAGILRDRGVGLALLLRGRLPVGRVSAIKGMEGLRRIIRKAQELEANP